jgi:hypothetical protein
MADVANEATRKIPATGLRLAIFFMLFIEAKTTVWIMCILACRCDQVYCNGDIPCRIKQYMSQESFNCSQCGQSFNSMSELDRHNQQQHQQQG